MIVSGDEANLAGTQWSGREDDLTQQVAALTMRAVQMRNTLSEVANRVADVEDQVAVCFDARASASADRAVELREHADGARRYAALERLRAADYALPVTGKS